MMHTESLIITQKISVTAQPKVQLITLELEEDGGIQYRLSYDDTTTEMLTEMSNGTVVEEALNNLATIIEIGRVMIKMARDPEYIELTITFVSSQPNLNNIVVSDFDNYTSEHIQDYQFYPANGFSISYDSRTTASFNSTSTAEYVESQLYELFTTKCTVTNVGDVHFYDDYEPETPSSSYGTPYCGRYSIRNPIAIYQNTNGFSEFTVTSFINRYVSKFQLYDGHYYNVIFFLMTELFLC